MRCSNDCTISADCIEVDDAASCEVGAFSEFELVRVRLVRARFRLKELIDSFAMCGAEISTARGPGGRPTSLFEKWTRFRGEVPFPEEDFSAVLQEFVRAFTCRRTLDTVY